MKLQIHIKRIYESYDSADGYRILIDRLWPRGIAKAEAHLDEWNKEVAPSTALRKAFNHQADRFEEFKVAYKKELDAHQDDVIRIMHIAEDKPVTLLYGAKDPKINHAIVLLTYIKDLQRP